MTNIVHFDKSRGFTRMDNQLMDGLMAIDLPGRELKVALFIAKATINFQTGAVRIKATDVSKATHLHPDVVSKAISHLLRRRVIHREGGARGDISLCDPKEWSYFECPTRTNRSDSDQMSRVVPFTSQTKTDDSLLYTKKETLLTLPSEEINPPLAKPKRAPRKPKAECTSDFGKTHMLANNPHLITEQLISDWLKVRKAKRAAMSQTVWDSLNAELDRCVEAGISADVAMKQAVLQGWQGFRMEWVAKRLAEDNKQSGSSSGPDFYSTDWRTDTSNDL